MDTDDEEDLQSVSPTNMFPRQARTPVTWLELVLQGDNH